MKMRKMLNATCLSLSLLGSFVAAASAATYYSPLYTFSIEDVQCDTRLYGSDNCLDMTNPVVDEKDGYTYYGIDSAYSFTATDFDAANSKLPIGRNAIYDDGLVANIYDNDGNIIGVKAKSPETPSWKAGGMLGAWSAGLGGNSVKASTEHYAVMSHIMEGPDNPLVLGTDYSFKLKDDGKYLFRWGNINKSPAEVRLYSQIPLPAGFVGGGYTVTKATLTVKHRISNSPNDQIRPEDFENENATGILPQYVVDDTTGQWLSTVDSYEGDGDFIPAGTVLADPANPLEMDLDNDGIIDYVDEKTNTWYTTLDRDPWGGDNPRYRFKSSKYGQDLPGVEMEQYSTGDLTTTTIDLLSIIDADGSKILQNSDNWGDFLDINEEKFDLTDDDLTADDCELSNNLDLMMYVKGEYKGLEIYDAQLRIDYIGGSDEGEPANQEIDVAVSLDAPRAVNIDGSKGVKVEVVNQLSGSASGTLMLTGTLLDGSEEYSFVAPFTVGETAQEFVFRFNAPERPDTISWTATATVADDASLDNNAANDETTVRGWSRQR